MRLASLVGAFARRRLVSRSWGGADVIAPIGDFRSDLSKESDEVEDYKNLTGLTKS